MARWFFAEVSLAKAVQQEAIQGECFRVFKWMKGKGEWYDVLGVLAVEHLGNCTMFFASYMWLFHESIGLSEWFVNWLARLLMMFCCVMRTDASVEASKQAIQSAPLFGADAA